MRYKKARRPPERRSRADLDILRGHKRREDAAANKLYDELNPNADREILVSKHECIRIVQGKLPRKRT